jgi:hypothetical protein
MTAFAWRGINAEERKIVLGAPPSPLSFCNHTQDGIEGIICDGSYFIIRSILNRMRDIDDRGIKSERAAL